MIIEENKEPKSKLHDDVVVELLFIVSVLNNTRRKNSETNLKYINNALYTSIININAITYHTSINI